MKAMVTLLLLGVALVSLPTTRASHGGYCDDSGQYAEICYDTGSHSDTVYSRWPSLYGCAVSINSICTPTGADLVKTTSLTTYDIPTVTVGIDIHLLGGDCHQGAINGDLCTRATTTGSANTIGNLT